MSSSSEVSSSELSSDEDIPPPPQSEMTMGLRGPPRQLCQCTKCVGQVTQKSYVCEQHIERYGRHRGLTPGASSSHMVSVTLQFVFILSHIVFFESLLINLYMSMLFVVFWMDRDPVYVER